MKTIEIRKRFLDFFERKKHLILQGSPLTIDDDQSLLFTNSGMVQFKNIFIGKENIKHKNIATAQLCVRVGGKHNDLENIGTSKHHNTSFEMLGNFSFSGYSKKNAIILAWEFLIQELNLDKSKIYISIHEKDIETKNIWENEINIDKNKIIIGNDISNFWMMGKTGPCGYCSEIFYNKTKNEFPEENDLIEIWNLVFMQFCMDSKNKLSNLKEIYIDTGMGLERIASIKQNVFDNFKIDIFDELLTTTKNILNTKDENESIRIIIDHIKTYVFITNEEILPSNDGRGYILKKLIRKAIIQKQKINKNKKLYKLIPNYINIINKYYNNIIKKNNIIKDILKYEEKKFEKTLKNGIIYLNKIINNKEITGNDIFHLYDTYGIPIDIIKEIIKNNNLKSNMNDFFKEMEKQKEKSIPTKKKTDDVIKNNLIMINQTKFIGYDKLKIKANIIKIIKNDPDTNNEEKDYIIILNKTPFFAEKGGQTGDNGIIKTKTSKFYVKKTEEIDNIILHYGFFKYGKMKENDKVSAKVNPKYRNKIKNNHTSTHLLNSALKSVLGKHIKQVGSLIKDTYLRFDFIHFEQLSENETSKIERIINNNITSGLNVKTKILTTKNAEKIFNITNIKEKYKEKIRIVKINKDVSTELCAGTHVQNTKNIKFFKIIREIGIGTNIRRIEAVTSNYAFEYIKKNDILLKNITNFLKIKNKNIENIIKDIFCENQNLKKENEKLQMELTKSYIKKQKVIILENKIQVITINLKKEYNKFIKVITNELKNTIIISYSKNTNEINFTISITNDLNNNLNALKIMNFISEKLNCKGGGKISLVNGIIYESITIDKFLNYIFYYINNIKILKIN